MSLTNDQEQVWVRIQSIVRDAFEQIAPKMGEYGAFDLELIGAGMPSGDPENGIAFYLLGKVARALSAWNEGDDPSDDTVMDAMVYAIIWAYWRKHGEWQCPPSKVSQTVSDPVNRVTHNAQQPVPPWERIFKMGVDDIGTNIGEFNLNLSPGNYQVQADGSVVRMVM